MTHELREKCCVSSLLHTVGMYRRMLLRIASLCVISYLTSSTVRNTDTFEKLRVETCST